MKLEVLAVIPLPVGRRVAVRWYLKKDKGLFGGATDEERPMEPVVEDLETGVVYAFDWLFDVTTRRSNEPSQYSESFSAGVEEKRVVVGRVAACRILTSINSGELKGTVTTQTELTITPEPETSAYR